jgi:hypothetical protein
VKHKVKRIHFVAPNETQRDRAVPIEAQRDRAVPIEAQRDRAAQGGCAAYADGRCREA